MKIENVPTFTKVSITLETLEEMKLMNEIAFYVSFGHTIYEDKIQPMAKEFRDFFELKLSAAAGHD